MTGKTGSLRVWVISIAILISGVGCSGIYNANIVNVDPLPTANMEIPSTSSATPFQALTNTPVVMPPTHTPTLTFTPTATFTPQPTDTPTPTDTPLPTETPSLVWNPPGYVKAPILLYHHVSDIGAGNRYYVTVDDFRSQMEALRDWGYSTITPSYLLEVLINGGDLPSQPLIITFDDGNYDIYENAFPIMREFGFVGAFYIVANRLQAKDFVNPEQLQEMAGAGWEIGSHSMTHADLALDYSNIQYEILQSRLTLEDATGKNIDTFAYAYGKTDGFVTDKVAEYGYRGAMGLGTSWEHYLGTMFYLSRIEIHGEYSLATIETLLPWPGN